MSSVFLTVFSFCGNPVNTELENHEFEVPAGFVVEQVAGEDLVDFPMFATQFSNAGPTTQLFLLRVMGNCNLESFPSSWLPLIKEALKKNEGQVLEKTLALIRSLQLDGLE